MLKITWPMCRSQTVRDFFFFAAVPGPCPVINGIRQYQEDPSVIEHIRFIGALLA